VTEPTTTAVVISHNHADYIVECLESVRDQTVRPSQVVLVDDGSSDDSYRRGAEFVEKHFSDYLTIHHPVPIGLCRSLNEALWVSTGDYLHTVAADDYWMPDKTASQLKVFTEAAARPAVVVGDALLIDADGRPTGGTFLERFIPAGLPPAEDLFAMLLRRNFLPGMSTLVRREVLAEVGGWDERLFYEDWDMWLRLASRWPFAYQDAVVAAYRYLPTSMSNSRVDEMWHSKLVISRKWAGLSVRADVGALERSLGITVRRAAHGDLSYARQWAGLLAAVVVRRVVRSRRPGRDVDAGT
jgi:glycosyltransferase involved in cell wall biosynthesis